MPEAPTEKSEKVEHNGTCKKPRLKPTENPWYLLATLYGQPTRDDTELETRNRIAWNRYMASKLSEESRATLIAQGRHPAEELVPLSDEDLRAIEVVFTARNPSRATNAFSGLEPREIDFSDLEFSESLRLSGFLFPGTTYFNNTSFSDVGNFIRATFLGVAFFNDASFSKGAIFNGSTFYSGARFKDATFSSVALFNDVRFFGTVWFEGATFSDTADFENASFGRTVFDSVVFSARAIFKGATFHSSISFMNAEMKAETSFASAAFKTEPPRFFGAKLHEGTVWRDATWPPSPNDAAIAGQFVDAYERLKLEMDRLKRHEDELEFFSKEMQCRRVIYGTFKGLPIALYGATCDYGRSYIKPIIWLASMIVVGTILFWLHLGWSKLNKAFGLSLANTFGVFGFRKDFINPQLVESLDGLKYVAAIQTTLGAVLLFLFGLAMRNRFRMK